MTENPLELPAQGDNDAIWPTVHVRAVSETERLEIAAVASMMRLDSVVDPAGYVRQARVLSARLPAALRHTLIDLERWGDGVLVITGLRVGPIGPTPSSPVNGETHNTQMAHTTALFVSTIANLVGYRAECWGRICQCIVPTKADQYRQTSTGSGEDLESHTEQASNMDSRPDVIALGCHRGDPNAKTYAMSARTLQRHLPPQAVALLRQRMFMTRIDASFIAGGVPDEARGPFAVLAGPDTDPIITYDEDLMWSDSQPHQEALDLVKQVWLTERESVVLQPGSVMILDNSRVVHGRSSFSPQFDGSDRWLCRLQGVYNLSMTRHTRRPGSPVIETWGC